MVCDERGGGGDAEVTRGARAARVVRLLIALPQNAGNRGGRRCGRRRGGTSVALVRLMMKLMSRPMLLLRLLLLLLLLMLMIVSAHRAEVVLINT